MSATYEQTTYDHRATRRHPGVYPKRTASGIGAAILNWLGRVGENSGPGRAAAAYQRLNAKSDAELAALGVRQGRTGDPLLRRSRPVLTTHRGGPITVRPLAALPADG